MTFITWLIICGLGALITGGAAVAIARGGKGNLTAWIVGAIGIGILVGASFRHYDPGRFDPDPAEVLSTEAEAYELPPAGAGESGITVALSGGEELRLALPSVDPSGKEPLDRIAPQTLADLWSEQAKAAGLPLMVRSDGVQIALRTQSKGEGVSLELRDATGGITQRTGLSAGRVEGSGQPTSLWRDIHDFLRQLFINALTMMIVPIIFFSIVTGVLSLGSGTGIGRIGIKTLGYYTLTSLLAILVGLFMVNLIAPGEGAVIELAEKPTGFVENATKSTSEFLFDFFLNLIPRNPVASLAEAKILQVIVFALLIGIFINRLPERQRQLLTDIFEALFETMMRIVRFLLWLAPIGVYAIFVKVVAETGPSVFADLGWYALAVFAGLLVHSFVTLPILLRVLGRVSPVRQAHAMGPALLTAFSTSSSSATLPLTMRCIEKRVGVSNRTTSFVAPLGATVNMDGTALYECVAAIFIAQIYISQGVIPPLTGGQQFLVVFTALAASIGAAGVPMAGMVMLGIILKALGLPLEGVGYVLAVDRLLDMCRTTVNVWSDSVGSVVIARSEGEDQMLTKWPPEDVTAAEAAAA